MILELTPFTAIEQEIQFASEYLNQPDVTELVVNGQDSVWTYRNGWHQENSKVSSKTLRSLATVIATYNGINLTRDAPILTARLPSGPRVHMTCPPVTDDYTLSIRLQSSTVKTRAEYENSGFFKKTDGEKAADIEARKLQSLYDSGNYSEFLPACVAAGKNIIVAGGTDTGKTTFIRYLLGYIPAGLRVLTCEDVAELNAIMEHPNCVAKFYNSTAKPNKNAVTAGDVLRSMLRMHPDRVICGELRGGEALQFIRMCSSGHGGSITSIHAGNATNQAIEQLEIMCSQSETAMPYQAIQKMVAGVVDVVVHLGKDRNARRHVTEIAYTP